MWFLRFFLRWQFSGSFPAVVWVDVASRPLIRNLGGQVHTLFHLRSESFFLAVRTLDRFLSRTPNAVAVADIQMLATACLLIATKPDPLPQQAIELHDGRRGKKCARGHM